MPLCVKCKMIFPNWINIGGKKRNLGNRKFCLNCSPFGKHNTKTLNAKIKPKDGQKVVCDRCHRTWNYKRTSGGTKTYCPACYLRTRFNKVKIRAVEYKGGKCVLCEYSKFMGALEFHHIKPGEKNFAIGKSYCLSWEKLRAELDKCVLICSRCHNEIHGGLWSEEEIKAKWACLPTVIGKRSDKP